MDKTISLDQVWQALENVKDPEVPVLSVIDLGIIRDAEIINTNLAKITITPTYSGCPAMNTIAQDIRIELTLLGFGDIQILETLAPAWTTDWMSEEGKKKLKEFGIAPPRFSTEKKEVHCPQCDSVNVTLVSEFGSTACKAFYKCLDCLEPFDYFKCI